jgi:GntR family transcriptional regulator, rspAB operon transcriptional repressor
MKQLTPISRERANDAVYSALRQAVLTSILKPGQKLNVSELALQLGVSLTPVRNAIQLLAAEGLIEVHPRSGTFVATVNANDVRETFEIRRALECLAVELATTHITGKELDQLRALLASMKKAVRTEEELLQHQQDNARFHMTILESARNGRLLDAYQRLNAHIQIARVHAAEPDWKSRLKDERAEHEEIVDAIASGDGPRGALAMRAHLDRACASLIQSIERKKKVEKTAIAAAANRAD